MALTDTRLSILTFPQRWTGTALTARVLLVPTGSPLVPLDAGMPPFAGTAWRMRTVVLPDLGGLFAANPSGHPGAFHLPMTLTPPTNAGALFQALPGGLPVKGAETAAERQQRRDRLQDARIRKELPESYRTAFPFERPRTEDAIVDDAFACALRAVDGGRKSDPKPPVELSWGRIIAFALRQPLLAEALGLLYTTVSVPVADPALVATGGWLYLELDPAAPGQVVAPSADTVRRYAARLPALDADPRALFGAVLFPVGAAGTGFDEALAEAAIYDDGFAKIMHAFQPTTADGASGGHNDLKPATDCGIDLGWDDEQVVIWHNRQLDSARVRLGASGGPAVVEAPLGVAGYRVDVRPAAGGPWQPLCRARSTNAAGNPADLAFPAPPATPLFKKPFDGELMVEPAPARGRHASGPGAWLPRYFARWQGGSLVVGDDTLYRLTGRTPTDANGAALQPEKALYRAAGNPPDLRYGTEYEFRCRLADLSGGGPATGDKPVHGAPAPTTTWRFLRHVPPKPVRIETAPTAPALGAPMDTIRRIDAISVWRPLIGYPEMIFAGVDRAAALDGAGGLLSQTAGAIASGAAIGANDPDVATVAIEVQVRVPAHDRIEPGEGDSGFRTIYQVIRDFPTVDPAQPLAKGPAVMLALDYQDVADVAAVDPPADGDPLPIPRARDVRIRLTPLCAPVADRYANDSVRRGLTIDLMTRAAAAAETALLVDGAPERMLRAIHLQPAANMAQRLAQAVGLSIQGLTFSARPGQRTVFGASGALRHSLTGDGGAITFAAESELKNQWIATLSLDLDRDWTWDGLEDRSVEILRRETPGGSDRVVGEIALRFAIDPRALAGDDDDFPDRRARTRLVFFDAVDPTPAPGAFPAVVEPRWTARLRPRGLPPQSVAGSVRLPVTSRPNQTPRLVSAGIALSPYVHDDVYSRTEPRERVLWLEFAEPVADKNDALYARVLAYGPDPLLSGGITHRLMPLVVTGQPFDPLAYARSNLPSTPDEPELAIDPEPIRTIVPSQPEDASGLDAMVELVPAHDSDRHFLLPLPEGVTPDSALLFGFWTYEFRIGHKTVWSTAQGRFGRPLRVTGVQHPAPALRCGVDRVTLSPAAPLSRIRVTAPYATAIHEGRRLTDPLEGDPRTRIWVMLYAQVMQADGASHRNVLLGHRLAPPRFDHLDAKVPRSTTRDVIGIAEFDQDAIEMVLAHLALPPDAPLSVLAVELLPGGGMAQVKHQIAKGATVVVAGDAPEAPPADPFVGKGNPPMATGMWSPHQGGVFSDPLGLQLGTVGSRRILRASPLTPVPKAC